MATFIETITTPGQGIVGSQNGRIIIDEAQGRLSITEQGGQERTRLDLLGLTTIRSNGEYSNRVGQASSDNRDGIWVAKPGIDLRDQGI